MNKITHIYIPLFPMELMAKQLKLFDENGKILVQEREQEQAPKVRIIKNAYFTPWGFVREEIIQRTYENKRLCA